MKFILLLIFIIPSISLGIPVENDELTRSELESQEVSYEGGGIRNNESGLRSGNNRQIGGSGIPLQRAITYTNPTVPLEFQVCINYLN